MKKKLFFTCMLVIIGWSVKGQTNISGFISANTNWTLSGSPYIITGNTIVDSGFTLTIDPGVIVKFDAAKSLQINGGLRAIGNSASKIIFTSNQSIPAAGDWDFIYFFETSDDYDYTLFTGSMMEYCVVEYGGGASNPNPYFANNGAIRAGGSFPFINYCEIRNNGTTGFRFFNDLSNPGTVKITNSFIHNNNATLYPNPNERSGGIHVETNLSLALIDNNIVMNNTGNNGAGGIACGSVNNINSVVSNNTVINNSTLSDGGGILVDYSIGTLSYNLVYGNTAYNGGGICRSNGGNTNPPFCNFNNNIIAHNAATNFYGGLENNGKLLLNKNTIVDNTSISIILNADVYNQNSVYNYNTITRNKLTGVAPTVAVFISASFPGTPPVFNNNNFVGNQATYELWNDNGTGAPALEVTNCWWNTGMNTSIDSKIYDFSDNSAFAVVDYTPFATSPDTIAPVTPPVNVTKTDLGGGNIKVTWNANPEMDLKGYKIYYGSPTGYSFSNFVDVGNTTTDTLTGLLITDTIAVTAYDSIANGTSDMFEGHESWFTDAIGKPMPDFSASPIPVCTGDTVFFTDLSVPDYTYANAIWSWSFPGGNPAVSAAQNPKVIYYNSGIYSVKLVVTNIAGSDSITFSNYIVVDTLPTPSIIANGPIAFCQGDSVLLDAGTGYNSYLWSSGEITQTVMVNQSGTYSATVSNHCGNSTTGISVTVNPLPTATITPGGATTFCQGDSVTLTASAANSYLWNNTKTTQSITINSSGNYSVTITDGNGCSATSTPETVTVNLVDTSLTVNNSTLTANATPAFYQWVNCPAVQILIGETNQTLSPSQNGNYAVIVTQNGCIDTSNCYSITLSGSSFVNSSTSIIVYPNPTHELLMIKGNGLPDGKYKTTMINQLGQPLNEKIFEVRNGSIEYQFDISVFASGIYFLTINSMTVNHVFKIQKQD